MTASTSGVNFCHAFFWHVFQTFSFQTNIGAVWIAVSAMKLRSVSFLSDDAAEKDQPRKCQPHFLWMVKFVFPQLLMLATSTCAWISQLWCQHLWLSRCWRCQHAAKPVPQRLHAARVLALSVKRRKTMETSSASKILHANCAGWGAPHPEVFSDGSLAFVWGEGVLDGVRWCSFISTRSSSSYSSSSQHEIGISAAKL